MRYFRFVMILAALLPVASACADTADSEASIMKLVASMSETWNAGDMPGYLDLYAKNDRTRLVFADTRLVGWQQIHDLYTNSWPDEEKMGDFSTEDVAVTFLDDRIAIVSGIFRHQFPDEKIHGAFSLVTENIEGTGWKIVFEHTSRGRSPE